MIYKSLLFKDAVPEKTVSAEVISDLKLDMILPPEVTEVLLYKPEAETLMLRRELLCGLLKEPMRSEEALDGMLSSLSVSGELYSALNRADSVTAASYIFVFLFAELSRFCHKVESFKADGLLYGRFSETLCELCRSEAFMSAEKESEELLDRLSVIKDIVIASDGENARVISGADECISERLRACAEELGIAISERSEQPVGLQKGIADAVARLYPDEISEANGFYGKYRSLVQGEIFDYIGELKFILGVIRFTSYASDNGIPHCFPLLSEKKELDLSGVYDVTLLKKEGTEIVPNDVGFNENEPFFYLTGANGGGKTTFLRAIGASALFFLAGMPVFCKGGRASLLSNVFTHFPRDERFEGTGRFVDEERRVSSILEKNDGNALVLLNETYSTTGEEKAVPLTEALAERLYGSGSFGIYITHQHGVTDNGIPFLSVAVDESDLNRRTYKIEKRRTERLSFARDVLEKHGLTAEALRKRLGISRSESEKGNGRK